jgi:alkylation response protein AidB-like acyl-CoA dehydrogenase
MALDAETRDQLIDTVRRFVTERLRPLEAKVSEDDAMPADVVEEMKALGLFGLFPLYIPPLFPTLTRTLGAGFTYNAGRLISAAGALFGGLLATSAGGNHRVIFWTALLYIPGMIITMMIPVPRETK